ncbi:MAG: 23S rRNA (adenine(2503)-C(2))-methyltransferase RlmN [Desulfosarcina sp.]|nr:23S rRNA (adenine(2503)-C(2))-methyltransferase RlmN [Desulfobacterales bacterium]
MRLLALTYTNLVETFAARYGKGPFLAGALYREFYKNLNPEAWQSPAIGASPGLTDRLERDLVFAPGAVVDEVCQEGLVKFVTELKDGQRIESVILPMETHHTVCVSSQAGCRMGCRFCETARMGLVRQLTVEEIVGQVYTARRRYGREVRNVVFMGMGEPFDNFDNVIQAVQVLSDQRGLDIAQRHITVSTAGLIDGIEKLAQRGMPHLKLAVSLNAPYDALRARLMPLNRITPLDRLQSALKAYPLKKGYDLMVAYVLIPGINDGDECVTALTDWLAPLRAKINLIPFNPGISLPYRSPTDGEMEQFRQKLIDGGINVQKRVPRGRDLMAACGQLGSRRNRCQTAR